MKIATEKRLIDANALMEEINEQRRASMGSFPRRYYVVGDALNSIRNAPTVDAEEVVHGRWEDDRCTNCGCEFTVEINGESVKIVDIAAKYCPLCGAKMDGGFDEKL